jgi:phosphorylated CTD-interacting factor 1
LLSRSQKPLSFVVVIPHSPEKPAWQKLANSAYAKRAVKLEAGKHGFVAGAQHLRPDKV